ncbi:MAG TPA: Rieske (2Fe-2S) protein [bacterium]|jgi:Rieske Fe-S protein
MDQTRRQFIRTCCALGAVGAASWLGIGCSKSGNSNPSNPQSGPPFSVDGQGRVVVNLSDVPALQQDNQAVAFFGTPLGHPLIVTHMTGDSYFALDSTCTHQSCTVDATSPEISCPCHGSLYNLNGTVARGPARASLPHYTLTKANNTLTIALH